MPATSLKQKKFMDAAAHNPAFAKQAGVPQSVAQDFSTASKGLKFGKDRSVATRADRQTVNNPKTNQGKAELFKKGGNAMATKKMFGGKESMKEELAEAKAIKSGKISPMQYAKGEKSEPAMKKGGTTKKMASGGFTTSANGIASKGKTKGTQIKMSGSKPLGMKKGGKAYC
jgi:hypothetical protein